MTLLITSAIISLAILRFSEYLDAIVDVENTFMIAIDKHATKSADYNQVRRAAVFAESFGIYAANFRVHLCDMIVLLRTEPNHEILMDKFATFRDRGYIQIMRKISEIRSDIYTKWTIHTNVEDYIQLYKSLRAMTNKHPVEPAELPAEFGDLRDHVVTEIFTFIPGIEL